MRTASADYYVGYSELISAFKEFLNEVAAFDILRLSLLY
jgi:hypothetical protein